MPCPSSTKPLARAVWLVGLEAATFGLPCVAFAHGGIPDWHDGKMGRLVKSGVSQLEDFVAAVKDCAFDQDTLLQCSLAAIARAQAQPTSKEHAAQLIQHFQMI